MDPVQRQRHHAVVHHQKPLRGPQHDRQQQVGTSHLLCCDDGAGELPRTARALPFGGFGLPIGAPQVPQEREPQHLGLHRHGHHVRERDGQVGVGQHGRCGTRHLHGQQPLL